VGAGSSGKGRAARHAVDPSRAGRPTWGERCRRIEVSRGIAFLELAIALAEAWPLVAVGVDPGDRLLGAIEIGATLAVENPQGIIDTSGPVIEDVHPYEFPAITNHKLLILHERRIDIRDGGSVA
jgi:hypothetical protein